MNYSELLHDFLDGTLAGEHQESLFHALAQDIDLRAEMQQLLRIKRAVQSDTEAFMPPPEARDAIFARLGFGASAPIPTPPVQVPSVQIPNAPIAETVIAAAAPIVQRVLWREVLLSSLATSLFTGLLFFFFLRPYGNSTFGGSMSTGFNSNGTIPPQSGYASAANFNASSVQTRDTVRVMREVVHHYHTGSQTSAATNDFQNGLQREFAQFQATMSALTDELRSALHDAREENKRLTAERNAETTPTTTTAPIETATTPALPQAPQSNPIETPKTGEWYNNLTLGVRGIRSRSVPQATIGSNAALAIAPNTAISALYRLAAHHEIGIEAGQEAFFQTFRSRNNEGIPFIIEQNPTLSWAGVAYRYTLFPESMLTPFVHTVLGGADVGLTGRAMLGVRFAPDNRTQFLLGAEASAIVYGHQGTWYPTQNIGFTYGVSIRF